MNIIPQPVLNSTDSVSRSETIRAIQTAEPFDIVVIGGGIHGAAVARLAAGCGFKTALLEKGDYASATSSRSSKMAHGGLRYLELLDFEQVFEGIKAREEMFDNIGYLVKPTSFLIPVPRGALFLKLKLALGLFLYDLLVKKKERKHRWIPRSELSFEGFHKDRSDLMGCFLYTDGIMSDTRMVIDNILGARRYGAACLNYCEVKSLNRSEDGISEIKALDVLSGNGITTHARLVINCAGPWASTLATTLGAEPHPLTFSRGSHVIFNRPWKGPSLFLPMPGKARYYFVWPHPAGTLVGTTEREVSQIELDPLPSLDEIEEILGRLAKDIPDAGLTRDNACYAFSGIRTLPIRGKKGTSSTLSRKHIWTHSNGVLTLLGGKYTTASWTASEGVREAARLLHRPQALDALKKRRDLKELPGSAIETTTHALERDLVDRGLPIETAHRLISRYGRRLIEHYRELIERTPEKIVALETMIALDTEQVETLDDLMRRRLELEYLEGHGEEHLPIIRAIFESMRPDINFDKEIERYRARMTLIDELIHAR